MEEILRTILKEVMPKVTLVPIERLVQPLTPTQKMLKCDQIAGET